MMMAEMWCGGDGITIYYFITIWSPHIHTIIIFITIYVCMLGLYIQFIMYLYTNLYAILKDEYFNIIT